MKPIGGTLTVAAVLLGSSSAFAQVAPKAPESLTIGDWTLTPVVEARVRGEYRFDLDDQHKGLFTERARLGVDVERESFEARVVLQDVRVWDVGTGGDMLTGPPPTVATGIYEAWGEAHTAGARPSFLRLGRQAITWGEGRLLGVSDWSPAGQTLDALRGRYVSGDGAFELFGAILEDPVNLTLNGATTPLVFTQAYGQLVGARAEWAADPLFALELYGLARFAEQNPSNPVTSFGGTVQGQTYTGALRLHGEGQGWTWGVEGAYQGGHVDSVAGLGTTFQSSEGRSAWAAVGHVAYAPPNVLLSPSFRLGGSYASGDDGGTTYKTFDPILPDVHTWYGAMDLLSLSNEIEGNARVAIAPWTDGVAALEYRYMRLAQAGGAWTSGYLQTIAVARGNTQAELGHEIDAMIAWSPWASVNLRAEYSAFVLGDGAKAILSQSNVTTTPPSLAHYGMLQATVRMP